ncbi:hypothetical protein Bbelb_095180 [Branchiostoma belcheri]|nr:hypothetical protein Bbelb_095180 [Branchiostoma belcheri]
MEADCLPPPAVVPPCVRRGVTRENPAGPASYRRDHLTRRQRHMCHWATCPVPARGCTKIATVSNPPRGSLVTKPKSYIVSANRGKDCTKTVTVSNPPDSRLVRKSSARMAAPVAAQGSGRTSLDPRLIPGSPADRPVWHPGDRNVSFAEPNRCHALGAMSGTQATARCHAPCTMSGTQATASGKNNNISPGQRSQDGDSRASGGHAGSSPKDVFKGILGRDKTPYPGEKTATGAGRRRRRSNWRRQSLKGFNDRNTACAKNQQNQKLESFGLFGLAPVSVVFTSQIQVLRANIPTMKCDKISFGACEPWNALRKSLAPRLAAILPHSDR